MVNAPGTTIIDSPVGPLFLAARRDGLTCLLFGDETAGAGNTSVNMAGDNTAAAARILTTTAQQLDQYFAGQRREFTVRLAPTGTDFQRAVWRGLETIPYGQTINYGELARRVDRPGAARAVGTANGANPISIIVPCHRVIGADGRLTGYGGGLPAKRLLLELEGVTVDGDRCS